MKIALRCSKHGCQFAETCNAPVSGRCWVMDEIREDPETPEPDEEAEDRRLDDPRRGQP